MLLKGLSVLSLTYKKYISVTLSFSPSHCSLMLFYEWQGNMYSYGWDARVAHGSFLCMTPIMGLWTKQKLDGLIQASTDHVNAY